MLLEILQSPEGAAVAGTLALVAAATPPLPTFVPQGTPPPTPAGGVGGGGTGGGGGGSVATGGGVLPGFALAVRNRFLMFVVVLQNPHFLLNESITIIVLSPCYCRMQQWQQKFRYWRLDCQGR